MSAPHIHGDIPLNPGITKTVLWLNEHGFTTTDSGDGKTGACECDRPFAYVTIKLSDPAQVITECDRLAALLRARGCTFERNENGEGPYCQSNYDPIDGFAIIDIGFIDDAMLFPDPP